MPIIVLNLLLFLKRMSGWFFFFLPSFKQQEIWTYGYLFVSEVHNPLHTRSLSNSIMFIEDLLRVGTTHTGGPAKTATGLACPVPGGSECWEGSTQCLELRARAGGPQGSTTWAVTQGPACRRAPCSGLIFSCHHFEIIYHL